MRPISRAARSGAVFTVTSLKGPMGCSTPFVCGKAMANKFKRCFEYFVSLKKQWDRSCEPDEMIPLVYIKKTIWYINKCRGLFRGRQNVTCASSVETQKWGCGGDKWTCGERRESRERKGLRPAVRERPDCGPEHKNRTQSKVNKTLESIPTSKNWYRIFARPRLLKMASSFTRKLCQPLDHVNTPNIAVRCSQALSALFPNRKAQLSPSVSQLMKMSMWEQLCALGKKCSSFSSPGIQF